MYRTEKRDRKNQCEVRFLPLDSNGRREESKEGPVVVLDRRSLKEDFDMKVP